MTRRGVVRGRGDGSGDRGRDGSSGRGRGDGRNGGRGRSDSNGGIGYEVGVGGDVRSRGVGLGFGRGQLGRAAGGGSGGHDVGVRRHHARLSEKSKRLLKELGKVSNNRAEYVKVVKKLKKLPKIVVRFDEQVELVANLILAGEYGGKLAIPSSCPKKVRKALKKFAFDMGIPKKKVVEM